MASVGPAMTAPEPQERWEKRSRHTQSAGGPITTAWRVVGANRIVANNITESDADRIIEDHERAGQVEALQYEADLFWGLYSEFYESQYPDAPVLTREEIIRRNRALDATAKGAE